MSDEDLEDASDLARLAYLVSAIGVANVLTLALMYAIEVPRGGPYPIGTVNDVTGGIYNLAVIPLLLALSRGDGSAGSQLLTRATVLSSVLGSASSFLLVAKVLPFVPSAVVSTIAISVQTGWMLRFGLRRHPSGRYPSGLLRLARLIGEGTLAGLPFAALGAAFPPKSRPRVVGFGVAAVVGGAAWVAVPAFWFLLGRALSRPGASR